MRNISFYCLLAVLLVASCRKNDDHVFDQSPDDRINETLSQYQSVIAGAADGWVGRLVTGDSSYFSFYFRFNNDNRVVMMSDFSTETATTPMESSYRLKALQQPSLVFDTYGYIHILSDPDANVNLGEFGQGRLSDFEYAIDTVTADNIQLTGRFNASKLNLKKATAQDRAAWEGKQIADARTRLRDLGKIRLYFKRMTLNSVQYEIQMDTLAKTAVISWVDGGVAQSVSRGYFLVPGGIEFSDPVVNGSTTIPGFTIVSFNNGSNTMNVTVNGTSTTIAGNNAPINPDKDAFTRFFNRATSAGIYWVSIDGFHIDGVDDALNLKSLKTDSSEYVYSIYWPNYDTDVDLWAPVYLHTAKQQAQFIYGQALERIPKNNGSVQFDELGWYGAYPASGPALNAYNQMSETDGYWFVQTGSRSYDMVSVDDAKIWCTWIWVWD
jgi:hypothetical protein